MCKGNKKWVAVYLGTSVKNTNSTFELQETLCRSYVVDNYPEFDVRIYKDAASGTNQEQLDKMMIRILWKNMMSH